jgi:hypothetical protein
MTETNFNFNAEVGQVNTGEVKVEGDNIGTQNNYYGDAIDAESLAQELDALLAEIAPETPTPEAEQETAIQTAIDRIEQNPSLKDRLRAAIKAGTFSAIEQFSEHPLIKVATATIKAAIEGR